MFFLQDVQHRYGTMETLIEEIYQQSRDLEEKYSLPSFQSSIKDIQIHSQRVTRLLEVIPNDIFLDLRCPRAIL